MADKDKEDILLESYTHTIDEYVRTLEIKGSILTPPPCTHCKNNSTSACCFIEQAFRPPSTSHKESPRDQALRTAVTAITCQSIIEDDAHEMRLQPFRMMALVAVVAYIMLLATAFHIAGW